MLEIENLLEKFNSKTPIVIEIVRFIFYIINNNRWQSILFKWI